MKHTVISWIYELDIEEKYIFLKSSKFNIDPDV